MITLDNPIEIDEGSLKVALVEIATPSEVQRKVTFSVWLFLISTVCTRNSVWKISTRCVAMITTTVLNLS